MRTALRVPAIVMWLTVLWVALWADISWGNIIAGLLVASFVVLVTQLDRSSLEPTYFRPHWAMYYVVVFLWKLLQSNLKLAWEIVTPTLHTHTAILAVPMRGGSEAVVNLVANSITLTPGTMTVDIHSEGDLDGDGALDGVVLYIHGMYTADIEAVRHDVLRLEELALRAFGTPGDYERAHLDLVTHQQRWDAARSAKARAAKAREEGDE
jgi:multicomponent Na+:H+ antiporter subunit E